MGKFKKQIDYWIHHVWVLFALLVSTALLILYLACREELLLILVLFFVGFVTLYFTSNMVIVMLFSIVFTGLLYIINIGQTQGSLWQNHGGFWQNPGHDSLWQNPGHDSLWQNPGHDSLWQNPGHDSLWQTMSLGVMSIEGMTDASASSTQPASTAELLAQSFPNTPTTPEDIEKLKLQIDLLDKLEKLGPLISTVSSMSSYMKTDK